MIAFITPVIVISAIAIAVAIALHIKRNIMSEGESLKLLATSEERFTDGEIPI